MGSLRSVVAIFYIDRIESNILIHKLMKTLAACDASIADVSPRLPVRYDDIRICIMEMHLEWQVCVHQKR